MSEKLAPEALQQRIATAAPDELKQLCRELLAENLLQAARWRELIVSNNVRKNHRNSRVVKQPHQVFAGFL